MAVEVPLPRWRMTEPPAPYQRIRLDRPAPHERIEGFDVVTELSEERWRELGEKSSKRAAMRLDKRAATENLHAVVDQFLREKARVQKAKELEDVERLFHTPPNRLQLVSADGGAWQPTTPIKRRASEVLGCGLEDVAWRRRRELPISFAAEEDILPKEREFDNAQ